MTTAQHRRWTERRAAPACGLARAAPCRAFIVMDVMQAAATREAQGHKVIHMEVGQPGTPAPRAALEAVQARRSSARRSATRWRSGLPALRERIARHYRRALRRRASRRSGWW